MFKPTDYEQLERLMAESPENRQLLQKLLDANAFTVSKISHELRNPLTLIYSTLQLIEAQHAEVKSFSHWPQMIEDVEFMTQLLNDLSRFNNSNVIASDTFSFYTFIEHLSLSFAASLTDSDVEFTSKLDSGLPSFTGDKTKLKEVFLNILRNATEAVSENGKIFLSACKLDDHIKVEIHDDGCGIPPEHLGDIFTPFTTYKQGGSGLGLPLAQKTIAAHKGTLAVDSSPGRGTRITVLLPI